MLLDWEVRVAFVEKQILEDMVGLGNGCVHVTTHFSEFEGLQPMDIAVLAVRVNARFGLRQGLERIADRVERLVAHLDEIERLGRGLLVLGDHRGQRIADVAHVLRRERIFVLADRQDAEGDREVLAGEHQVHAGMGLCLLNVNFLDQCMRMRRAQKLHVQHARQHDVVRKARLAGDLGAAIDPAARLTEDFHRSSGAHPLRSLRRSAGNRCNGRDSRRSPR